MVIEELRFAVPPAQVDAFLARDDEVWTTFLQTCDGFVAKEVWLPEPADGHVVVQIWWNSLEQWQAIPGEVLTEVDARMGDLWVEASCSVYRVALRSAPVTRG
jgi:uncharacterized protein (TIGR03792 family)